MIGVFRRLNAHLPVPPPLPVEEPPAELVRLRRDVAALQMQLRELRLFAHRETVRADKAEELVREITVAHGAGPLAAENGRLRKALIALEDVAEGCRRHHGSNTRASYHRPDVTAQPTYSGAHE